MTVTLADIERARNQLAGHILRTPMLPAPRLSSLTGADVYVKYENLQVTSSFKERGAINKLVALTEDECRRGVICMSAGNHAQAVACHARRLNISATIVMPVTTPQVKVLATEAYGAKVVLHGETLSECHEHVAAVIARRGLVLVHPYDDDAIIAGQGTIALEMLDEVADLDVLVVPVGGGGLIAGTALAARAVREHVEIVGAEAALYPSMYNAVTGASEPVGGPTLAEGIAVKEVGERTLPVVRALVSDIVLVNEAHLERAVNAFLTLQKTVAEGAGAAGLAALFAAPDRFAGRKVGLILSGGNIDARILASIAVRELERDGRIVSIRLTIADRPGVLGAISMLLAELGANILEVEHRRRILDVPAKGAKLDVTLEARDHAHTGEIMRALEKAGYLPVALPVGT